MTQPEQQLRPSLLCSLAFAFDHFTDHDAFLQRRLNTLANRQSLYVSDRVLLPAR